MWKKKAVQIAAQIALAFFKRLVLWADQKLDRGDLASAVAKQGTKEPQKYRQKMSL